MVEYWRSENDGKWYFHRKARNGRITDPSQGYADRSTGAVRRAARKRFGPDVELRRIHP